jgi:CBS domain-containing protein
MVTPYSAGNVCILSLTAVKTPAPVFVLYRNAPVSAQSNIPFHPSRKKGVPTMPHYTVKNLMVLNPVVISPEASLKEAADKMRVLDCGIMPVGTPDKLVGMITDRDITLRAVANGKDPVKTKVGDVMTNKVFFVEEDETLDKAAEIFNRLKINRLLVKDGKGRLTGILSLSGLIRDAGDAAVLGDFIQQLARQNQRRAA